jgi:hypothetical protein
MSMAVIGMLSGVGLWLLGVPMAASLGVLAGVLGFVPFIGATLFTAIAVIFAFSQGAMQALYVLLLCIAVQQLEGEVITPLIQRWAVALPPLLTIMAVLIFGTLVGFMGVLVCVFQASCAPVPRDRGHQFHASWAGFRADGWIGSEARVGVKGSGWWRAPGVQLSHAFASQFDAMGVVHKAVEDRVSQGRAAHHLMPLLDRHLAGDDGRSAPVAILQDLQQLLPLGLGQPRQTPVVENEQLHPGQHLQHPGVAPVAARQGERLEQPWQPLVKHAPTRTSST